MKELVCVSSAPAELAEKVLKPPLLPYSGRVQASAKSLYDGVAPPPPGGVSVLMGTKAVQPLKDAGIVPKNLTLGKLRGKPIAFKDGHFFITYDPQATYSDASAQENISWDISLACRFLDTGTIRPQVGQYGEAQDFSAVRAYVEHIYAKTNEPVQVSLDLETLGLDPYCDGTDPAKPAAYIVSMSATVAEGVADVVYFPNKLANKTISNKLHSQIEWLLNSPMVRLVLANGKYDLNWIWVHFAIECTNFKLDTMLAGSLLNENVSNSLNSHAKLYTAMGGYDDDFNVKYDKGRMDLIPKEEVVKYNGGDTDACYRTATVLKKELLQDPELARFYIRILHPGARAFEKIERRGVLVDKEKYKELELELNKTIAGLEAQMLELIPGRIKAKYYDKIESANTDGKNPFTPALIKDYFFSNLGLNLKPQMMTEKSTDDKPNASTSYDHLIMFKDNEAAKAFVDLMEKNASARKTLSTYVLGFLKHLRSTGRFHPSYMLFRGPHGDDGGEAGTTTGRTSARDPAIQTLPKLTDWAKKLRACYIAPPGKIIFQIDFNQGELRIAACLANEPVMIDAYKHNKDLHSITAARINGFTLEEFLALEETNKDKFDDYRRSGKVGNFGLLYGMGVEGFREFARTAYGVEMTSGEAQAARNAFFDLYGSLTNWHDFMRKLVKRHGEVRSPLGRVRRLPLIWSPDSFARSQAERQAINSPVQSTLSDLCVWLISLIETTYPNSPIEIVGMTHDSIYGYLPEDNYKPWLEKMTGIAHSLPIHEVFGWQPQVAFPVDCEVGPNLAALKKLKLH